MGKSAACDRRRICRVVILVNIISLFCSGIFCLFLFPTIFNSVLEGMLTIKEGTPAYDAWKKPIIPTKIKIYFFNVDNPAAVENGLKPSLSEIGPFTYREETERVEEVFFENGTVSYKTRKLWFFLENESQDLDTIVSTVDIPVLASAEYARGNWWTEKTMATTFAFRSSFFTNKTARELLFDGYSDPLLDMGSMFVKEGGVPKDKFGWFYKRNGTTWNDGVINMATGSADFQDVGSIKFWHGSNRTIYPDECGDLKGTSAGFTPPNINRQFIDYFSTDICRPIRFDKSEYVDIEGINATKFSLDAFKTFGNEWTNPENHCFNANAPSGMHNSTGCKGGDTTLKTFVSLPHFLGADPFYQDQFTEGSLHADPELHNASITIQPETSIPVQVLMRLQIIVQIRSNPTIAGFMANLPDVFLPVFWFDAEAVVTSELADQIRIIPQIPGFAKVAGIPTLLFGVLMLVLFLWLQYTGRLSGRGSKDVTSNREKVQLDVNMKLTDINS